ERQATVGGIINQYSICVPSVSSSSTTAFIGMFGTYFSISFLKRSENNGMGFSIKSVGSHRGH
ncbi:hypothetical protein P9265_06135, partial [Schinkia azotoformans]|uniref:hypothetical protein n=1 Tax=Schinkia azotoformans TaxID=1454 RepID=UPI002E1A3909|nr:hypothetical protein [Schinkia azotoformans]